MTNQNKAALVSVQDLEYVVQQPRQAGSVADEEGELIDRLDHLQSRLRAPVAQGERAAFDESYRTLFSVPAATPLTFPDVPDAWSRGSGGPPWQAPLPLTTSRLWRS